MYNLKLVDSSGPIRFAQCYEFEVIEREGTRAVQYSVQYGIRYIYIEPGSRLYVLGDNGDTIDVIRPLPTELSISLPTVCVDVVMNMVPKVNEVGRVIHGAVMEAFGCDLDGTPTPDSDSSENLYRFRFKLTTEMQQRLEGV